MILDSCVDYWDGRDLTPLSAADRKKIIDFYQRNSLTAYCTAFAYKSVLNINTYC
ncbi:Transmembrane protein 94 [Plutella xylostella]|uniref:Transmembrane protein 94 n=1 Tax=Plutella xylostella TaxID=51655 RepID=A0ABQ7QCQ1_PLUXY|nr:Transmembrane protein 94 [Plutella xylostella]